MRLLVALAVLVSLQAVYAHGESAITTESLIGPVLGLGIIGASIIIVEVLKRAGSERSG